MDYNVALYTTDLDSYVSSFEAGEVDYMSVEWTLPAATASDDDTTYYGIMVHVTDTQMVLEIMSESESKAHKDKSRVVQLEQRASHRSLKYARERIAAYQRGEDTKGKVLGSSSSDYLTVLSIGRATSKIDEVESFYVDDMQVCGGTLALSGRACAHTCIETNYHVHWVCVVQRMCTRVRALMCSRPPRRWT